MKTKTAKKGKTRQVRMREDKANRVDILAVLEGASRKERIESIDLYDEILEKELPKYERKYNLPKK